MSSQIGGKFLTTDFFYIGMMPSSSIIKDLKRSNYELETLNLRESERAEKLSHEISKLRQLVQEKDKEIRSLKVKTSHSRKPLKPLSENKTKDKNEVDLVCHEENKRLKSLLKCQEGDLNKAADEIEVLACALEERAETLQVDGNLKSGLLYELAANKVERMRLEKNIFKLDREAELVAVQMKDMRILNDQLNRRLNESNRQVEQFTEERTVMLDYIQDKANQICRLETSISKLSHPVRDYSNGDEFVDFECPRCQVSNFEFEKLLMQTNADIEKSNLKQNNEMMRETIAVMESKLLMLEKQVLKTHPDLG